MSTRKRKPPTLGAQHQPPLRDASAAMRVKTAIELACAGHDWDTIAHQAGYPSRGTAFKAVQRELERTLRPACDQYRELESTRLDKLLTVYWPRAMDGDGWSFDRVLRLMERRATLMGLDLKPEAGAPTVPLIFEVPATLAGALRGESLSVNSQQPAVVEAASGDSDAQ